jgi:hypothetical protein
MSRRGTRAPAVAFAGSLVGARPPWSSTVSAEELVNEKVTAE